MTSLLEAISPTSRALLRHANRIAREEAKAAKGRKPEKKSWLEELDTPVLTIAPANWKARK